MYTKFGMVLVYKVRCICIQSSVYLYTKFGMVTFSKMHRQALDFAVYLPHVCCNAACGHTRPFPADTPADTFSGQAGGKAPFLYR